MNSILFFVLAALPLLAFGAAPTATKSQVLGCNVLKYSQIYYSIDADNLLPGRAYPASSFEDCIQRCLSTPQCKAVNFIDGKQCVPYRNGLSNANTAASSSYMSYPTSVHGYIDVDSCPKPKATTTKYLGCDILKYFQTTYKTEADNLSGPDSYYTIPTIEKCLDECFRREGCKAVNFDNTKCFLYRNGLADPNTLNRDSYALSQTTTHAYIKCPDLTATGPVGCGVQGDNYKPTLGKVTRIIGGTIAKPHSWPWQVKLVTDTLDGYVSGCGSSLVRVNPNKEESDILITAAHCVTWKKSQDTDNPKQYDPSQMTAKAGTHDLEAPFELGRQVRKAAQILKHPNYRRVSENDIAIIKLETPIKFSDTIRPICLADATEDIPTGKYCAVSGWGRNDSSNVKASSTLLKQLAVPVQTAQFCKTAWGNNPKYQTPNYVEDQMICAGDTQGKESTCQGDSGGMLACQRDDGGWTLYGATSFGTDDDSCLKKGLPAVFARVSKYRKWIDDNIKTMTSVK